MSYRTNTDSRPEKKSLLALLARGEEQARRAMTAMDRFVDKARRQEELERNGNWMTGLDGYSNPLVGLGESSLLMSAGTFLPSYLTRDIPMLTNIYRGSWLARKIIDMPAEDMTRNWYKLSTTLKVDELQKLKDLEAKHSVKQELTNALRWARLYGGCMALMVVNEIFFDNLSTPLDPELLLPDCFHGLIVIDRTTGITPSIEHVKDINDPDFGLPMYYTVQIEKDGSTGMVNIHHSRLLRFTGRELPGAEMEKEEYWGASELEHILDELMKRENISANIAQLVFQANVTTLKSGDVMAMMSMGTTEAKEGIARALEFENQMRSSYGIQLLGSDDVMENLPYSFAGLSDVYKQFMLDMAGAAEIPATKLFGRSPDGENATGESDLRNYYDMISSLQERMLRPALEKLLPIMAISCWGFVPKDMKIVFEPVMTMSAKEQMEMAEQHMRIIKMGMEAGIVTAKQAQEELRAWSEQTGVWSKI